MRVKWLRKAIANLDAEAEYIARDSPAAAVRVVARITEAVDGLRRYPSLGRAVVYPAHENWSFRTPNPRRCGGNTANLSYIAPMAGQTLTRRLLYRRQISKLQKRKN